MTTMLDTVSSLSALPRNLEDLIFKMTTMTTIVGVPPLHDCAVTYINGRAPAIKQQYGIVVSANRRLVTSVMFTSPATRTSIGMTFHTQFTRETMAAIATRSLEESRQGNWPPTVMIIKGVGTSNAVKYVYNSSTSMNLATEHINGTKKIVNGHSPCVTSYGYYNNTDLNPANMNADQITTDFVIHSLERPATMTVQYDIDDFSKVKQVLKSQWMLNDLPVEFSDILSRVSAEERIRLKLEYGDGKL